MRHSLAIISLFVLLSGCSTAALTSPTSEAPTAKTTTITQPAEINKISKKGYDDGCKGALKNQWEPLKSTLDNLNNVQKVAYIDGWKKGYQRCVIGLGPVIINSTMPIAQPKK